jgi:hypothetical protein
MDARTPVRSLRERLERLLFAGLKPGMRSSEIRQPTAKDYLLRAVAVVAAIAALAALYYGVAAAGRSARQESGQLPAGDIGQRAPGDVEVVDLSMNLNSEPKSITGTVKNDSERNFRRVEVTFALTDDNGSAIGVETVSVADVKAKTSVPFRASIITKGASYYVIRDIAVF